MIEPQIYNSQGGIVGTQHGLARLTETLAALRQGQIEQQTRDTQIQTQLTAQATAVGRLQTWGQRLTLLVGGLTIATLGLAGVVGWQLMHPPTLSYVQAVSALDTTLVQVWPTLPKATQESLSATYARLGLQSPGQRK